MAVRISHQFSQRVFRIYTEDLLNLHTIVPMVFEGATIIKAQGIWQGHTELAIIVEIIGSVADRGKVLDLGSLILERNSQTAVIVTEQELERVTTLERIK